MLANSWHFINKTLNEWIHGYCDCCSLLLKETIMYVHLWYTYYISLRRSTFWFLFRSENLSLSLFCFLAIPFSFVWLLTLQLFPTLSLSLFFIIHLLCFFLASMLKIKDAILGHSALADWLGEQIFKSQKKIQLIYFFLAILAFSSLSLFKKTIWSALLFLFSMICL